MAGEVISREEFDQLCERISEIEKQLQRISRVDAQGRVWLHAHEVRARRINVLNDQMQACVTLMTNADGGRMGMRSTAGQTVWVAGAAPDGGVIGLCNARGKVFFKASGGPDSGSIALSSRKEKNFWTAP